MASAQNVRPARSRPQAIFLDRDGTINRERADYVKTWQEYEWLPGALSALAALAKLEVPILVVTNQSVVGRGILAAGALQAIHAQARAEALAAGGRLDDFLICPHAPADLCACRKPKPGLLLEAAARYNLDLRRCVFVGDSITDMQAAVAAGCAWLLVRTGRQGATLDAVLAAMLAEPHIGLPARDETDNVLGSTAGSTVEALDAQVVDDLGAATELIANAAAVDHLHFETSFE
jgi:D-glycero-D-manno-heptose 1,7-bisphosphate phosphatase